MDDKEREKASTDVAKFMNAPGMCNIIFWDSFYKRMNPALPSIIDMSDCRFSIFFYQKYSFM